MAKLSVQDTHFMKIAAIAGMAEVNDGTLAENMGDATVKNIGARMVADHTKANQQLMSIAKQKGVAGVDVFEIVFPFLIVAYHPVDFVVWSGDIPVEGNLHGQDQFALAHYLRFLGAAFGDLAI